MGVSKVGMRRRTRWGGREGGREGLNIPTS